MEKFLEDVGGVPSLQQLKGKLLEELYDAAQDSGKTYELRTAIVGKVFFDKECPIRIIGFVIMPDFCIMQVQGQKSARIQTKWSRIAEEILGIPIDLSWGYQPVRKGVLVNVSRK